MAKFEVLIKPSAVKEIEAIGSKKDRQRIAAAIQKLSENPRPAGSQKLSGTDKYRVRYGVYRRVYSVEDKALVVYVVKVGHRRDVYR
ncbi:MAG: type II toxin-antitoxin system RelE/ParE family toxin [Candidatus Hydrogenedentales bacterium]